MAISVLNVTHHDGAPGGGSNLHTISIPATTAGSTLIVLVGVSNSTLLTIGDDEGNVGQYLQGANCSVSASAIQSSVNYRANCPAGLTFVNVYTSANGRQTKVSVYEVAGINAITPFEAAVNNSGTAASGPWYESSTLTTAFTNAFFVVIDMQGTGTLGNFFNSPFYGTENPDNSSSTHIMGYYTGSGGVKARANKSTPSATYAMVVACFNPTPNAYTLGLSDSVTTDDGLDNAAAFIKALAEGVTLTDVVDATLSTHEHFKTLTDTATLGVTIATVAAYNRVIQDQFSVLDEITFVKDIFRTKTDSVRIADWLSIKKTPGNWGN